MCVSGVVVEYIREEAHIQNGTHRQQVLVAQSCDNHVTLAVGLALEGKRREHRPCYQLFHDR